MQLFKKFLGLFKKVETIPFPVMVVDIAVTVESANTVVRAVDLRPEDLDVAGDVHGRITIDEDGIVVSCTMEHLTAVAVDAPSPALSTATTLVGSPVPPSTVTTVCQEKQPPKPPSSTQAVQPYRASPPPTRRAPRTLALDDLRLIRYLGGGGQGQVWLVEHIARRELYALKAISKAVGVAGFAPVFLEQDVMRRLAGSAFFGTAKASFEDWEFFYILMDYQSGGDLESRVEKGRLGDREARRIAAEIVHAMEDLHGRGIIHRDLKPQNVLFNARGQAVVADLGLARTFGLTAEDQPWRKEAMWRNKEDLVDFDAAELGDVTQAHCGTFHYMAPEIFARTGYSYPVDVWSFAVTLYEMLHGKLPFGGDEDIPEVEFISRIMLEDVEIASYVHPDARDLLQAAFSKDPLNRPTWAQMKSHPWFGPINWRKIAARKPVATPATPNDLKPEAGVSFAKFGEPYAVGEAEHPFFHWVSPGLLAAPIVSARPTGMRTTSSKRRFFSKSKTLRSLFTRKPTPASKKRLSSPSTASRENEQGRRQNPCRSSARRFSTSLNQFEVGGGAGATAHQAVARARPAGAESVTNALPAGCATTTAKFDALMSDGLLSDFDG
ncbi:kinase-like domain-containing protein [Trametes maxima]|nr:kinase-like domain-containing protein [Trametes maxima]